MVQLIHRHRALRGVRGLSAPVPGRAALERALAVAQEGLRADPPVDPPREMVKVLRFRKMSATAWDTVARALDDGDFRGRVAEACEGEDLDRASWLLLHRPDGWEDELADLVTSVAPQPEPATAGVDSARLEKALVKARAERDAAQARADKATRRADEAKAALEVAKREKHSEATERGRAERDRASAQAALARVEADLADARTRLARLVAEVEAEAPAPEPDEPWAGLDRSEIAGAVSDVAAAAATLASDLARLAERLRPPPAKRTPRSAGPTRRRAPPLPPMVTDDDPQVGDHLLKAGVLLLVDGYNATINAWPDLEIAEQRDRLVDALCEAAARTHADIHVVFDGANVPAAPSGHRPIRVTFTPEDEEADDRILAILDAEPSTRPCVVASEDGRVRRGSQERGAAVLDRRQLFHLMRREL